MILASSNWRGDNQAKTSYTKWLQRGRMPSAACPNCTTGLSGKCSRIFKTVSLSLSLTLEAITTSLSSPLLANASGLFTTVPASHTPPPPALVHALPLPRPPPGAGDGRACRNRTMDLTQHRKEGWQGAPTGRFAAFMTHVGDGGAFFGVLEKGHTRRKAHVGLMRCLGHLRLSLVHQTQ